MMSAQLHPSDSLVFECDFEEPPEKVWRALTEPQLLEAWLTAEEPSRTDSAEGKSSEGADGKSSQAVAGTARRIARSEYDIVSAEPHRRLRFRWRDKESAVGDSGGREVHSMVTFELAPGPAGGTHLRLTHGEFRFAAATPTVVAEPTVATGRVRPIASAGRRSRPIRFVAAQSSWRRAA